ncbi:MAG: hypothetical protein B7Z66_09590 [Chromatiales bacterium 21-64-14]|nr:MAG: hypothetical protein B7Z66_09590 [Chromatiales bacterium 21-64-14]HQU16323.1 EAL domain-containing protein [Gammaproteobacteria bacterium]
MGRERHSIQHILHAGIPLMVLVAGAAAGGQWLAAVRQSLPLGVPNLTTFLAFTAALLALAAYRVWRDPLRLWAALGLLMAAALHGLGGVGLAWLGDLLKTLDVPPVVALAAALAIGFLPASGYRIRSGWSLLIVATAIGTALLVLGRWSAGTAGASASWIAALPFGGILWMGFRRRGWRADRFRYWLLNASAWATGITFAGFAPWRPAAGVVSTFPPGAVDVIYGCLIWGAWSALSEGSRQRRAATPGASAGPLSDTIARLVAAYREDTPADALFQVCLTALLEAVGGGYGLIGEVRHERQGRPFFALRVVGTGPEIRCAEMEVHDPDTPIGTVVHSGHTFICNDSSAADTQPNGLPPGHPSVHALLVVPLYVGDTLIAIAALANRPGGYAPERVEQLQPLLQTCAMLLRAWQDAHGRRTAEEAVRSNLAAMEASIDGMSIVAPDGRYTYANRAHCELHGYQTAAELIGESWQILYDERELDRFRREIIPQFMKRDRWRGECIGRRVDGSTFPQELSLTAMGQGGMVCVVRDITERKIAEGRIHHLAHYDALTGLPNRRLLQERLGQAVAQTRRAGRMLAVLFVDLDHFKPINDSLGHDAGDELLKIVSGRLTEAVRESDIVARLGGDEFIVALTNLAREQDAVMVAEKVRGILRQPVALGQAQEGVEVSCSIGISMYPTDGTEIDVLLRKSDAAMYRAKARGRDGYIFHGQAVNARMSERLHLERALRRALDQDEFILHFQPVMDLVHDRVMCVEALLRWRNPDLGVVFPSNFIPYAEECGLIVPIGRWVLEQACVHARALAALGSGDRYLSINLSQRQFRDPALVETLIETLKQADTDPRSLALEFAELTLTDRVDPNLGDTLKSLSELGIRICVDNYGISGVSPLQLKRYPLHALKIDRSLVQELPTNLDCAQLTAAIIAMSRTLGIRVMAGGVETAEQLSFLRAQRCDAAQGIHVSGPMPWEECLTWLEKHQCPSAAARVG